MSVRRIAERYARSLIDLSLEQGVLEEIVDDIRVIQDALANRDLFNLLKSPIVHLEQKKKIFNLIFRGKLHKLSDSFFATILRKNREMFISEIADAFVGQYKEIKGITTVRLTSAVPLSKDTLEQIRQKLETSDQTTQYVEIITQVDASLLGGFVIEFEDKLYDASIQHQLEEMRKELVDNNKV